MSLKQIRDNVVSWADRHSEGLRKFGKYATYGAPVLWAATFGAMKYFGIENPDIQSYSFLAGSIPFTFGEAAINLAEHTEDVKTGNVDVYKTAGRAIRVLAPLYGVASEADGIWQGFSDIAVPVLGWGGGHVLQRYGQGIVNEEKEAGIRRIMQAKEAELGNYIGSKRGEDLIAVAKSMTPNEVKRLEEELIK